MKSQKPDARQNLADSFKYALEECEIEVSDIAKRTRSDQGNWYKRVAGNRDIKLLDVLIICECMGVDTILFLTKLIRKYYSKD